MIRIPELVAREVAAYNHVRRWKAQGFYIADVQQQLFAVIEVPDHDHPDRMPLIVVMARIVGDNVVIDADATDRPLYEALLIAGIPRENLILGYLGETEPGEPTA